MLKVASDIYKMPLYYTELPTPLRTPQTSGHYASRISDLPLRSLKSPPSHGSKIIIFYLSKSKCTVSALFLHGFKGCNGHSDLQNTTKGAEIARRKITMLCTKITQTRKFQNQSVLPGGLFWMPCRRNRAKSQK